MKFGIIIIWDVKVTLGPFSKYIHIKEHKDRKVTFCDITILNSQTVLYSMLQTLKILALTILEQCEY